MIKGFKIPKVIFRVREGDTSNDEEICAIGGKWIGVDLIVSEDREKVPPYVLEINSQPGHVGYDSVHSGSILKDVLVKFMNRDNWT